MGSVCDSAIRPGSETQPALSEKFGSLQKIHECWEPVFTSSYIEEEFPRPIPNIYREVARSMSANARNTPLESKDLRIHHVLQTLSVQPAFRTAKLAVIVGLSTSYLREVFKRELGLSIDQYRMEMRLQRACDLLTGTFLSVKEIRNEVGMPDASNFVYHFRHRFGITPSNYRRLH
jgi:AraC-like DNA-binding protein